MNLKEKIILISIILLAFFLRFYNLNWDQNSHLHPDERFLTMVGGSMKTPPSFSDYLNPTTSTFNPVNIGYGFFVYGVLPLTINKLVAIPLGNDTYDNFTIQGRALSATADLLVVIAIFILLLAIEKRFKLNPSIKFFAAFIYAVSVLPIQLSHFFAVDTFLNLFMFLSFSFAFLFWTNKKIIYLILSAIFISLALASKISAIYIIPLLIFFLFTYKKGDLKKTVLDFTIHLSIFTVVSYIVLKITDPYMFASASLINPTPNEMFISNLQQLKALSSKSSFYPPMVQWLNKTTFIFPMKNIILWGFGIPAFSLFIVGIYRIIKTHAMRPFIPVVIWVLGLLIYQGIQTTPSMRYFVLIYPFMAIFAGFGLCFVYKISKPVFYFLLLLLIVPSLLFFSIYAKPNSRVAASQWIDQNISDQSVILSEHWDDSLPVRSATQKNYQVIELQVFGQDNEEKWATMNDLLEKSDYLILSSNRGWGSIPTVPKEYPLMSKFYKDLFANKLYYKKIKEFTSYPSLNYLGIPISINDTSAEEAFSVYDHPKVMIFKNTKK